MKELFRKVSFTLVLAVLECALGVLLLSSPGAFTTAIIVALGVVFAAAGVYSAVGYCRLSREEAARTWKLSIAAADI